MTALAPRAAVFRLVLQTLSDSRSNARALQALDRSWEAAHWMLSLVARLKSSPRVSYVCFANAVLPFWRISWRGSQPYLVAQDSTQGRWCMSTDSSCEPRVRTQWRMREWQIQMRRCIQRRPLCMELAFSVAISGCLLKIQLDVRKVATPGRADTCLLQGL